MVALSSRYETQFSIAFVVSFNLHMSSHAPLAERLRSDRSFRAWRSQRPEECGALTKTATGEATSALAVKAGTPGEGIPQVFGKLGESEK